MFIHLFSARAATSSRAENNYHPESFFLALCGDAFAWLLSPCLSVCLANKCWFIRLVQVECGINSWCKPFLCIMKCFVCASAFALFMEASRFLCTVSSRGASHHHHQHSKQKQISQWSFNFRPSSLCSENYENDTISSGCFLIKF